MAGDTAEEPGTNLVEAAKNTLSALMSQISVDQDVSCRIVGRCSYGGIIDREVHDLTPATPGIPDQPLPLDVDTGKAFLYARYNAELTPKALDDLGLGDIDAQRVRKMDEVGNIDDLSRIGKALAAEVRLEDLGSFAP